MVLLPFFVTSLTWSFQDRVQFVYGVIGDNFRFLSVGDSDDFAFGGIKFHQPVRFPCLLPVCRLAMCLRHVLC